VRTNCNAVEILLTILKEKGMKKQTALINEKDNIVNVFV
jgi:hypothetical protein